ncbi:hypothetical protein BDF14DRAFT_1326703 [Spinellus fusiger]|nr:hypothetical protein BDF14DRAFT_1326703 [Spinellus fusiger]
MDPSLRITVDTNSGRCCKSWCKFLVLGLLVWFILIKSIGLFGDDGVGNNYLCNQEITRVWNGMPARLPVIKDIAIIIKSPVTEGTINIKMLPAGTQGYIEHTIQSTSDVMDGIDYSYISGSTSALGITFPKRGDGRTCAYIDLNVYLPVETDSVYIQVDSMRIRMEDEMNIDNISLQTANAGIRLFKKWTGKNLSIRSTNSNIVTDAIIAENQIDITTTNGKIQVTDAVALNKILLTSSNGGLYGLSLDSRIIQLKTTNGNIDYNMITADNVIIETSNAQINVIAKSNNVFLMTTNGKVTAKVNSHNKPKVSVTTSNAPAHLYLVSYKINLHQNRY